MALILHWPARIAPGIMSDEPVDLVGLYAPFAELTRSSVPEKNGGVDGFNLVPALDGKPLAANADRLHV